MKSAKFAEFLLRRTTGPDQAAAQVGDLLELSSTHGRLWFWQSVLGTLARRTWRSFVGVLLAYWVIGWAFHALMQPVLSVLRTHHGTISQEVIGGALASAGATWTMLAVHAAIRSGIRNSLARAATVLAASVWLYLGLLWQPLPWAGLAFLPVLACALFVKGLRIPVLNLFLPLPAQLVAIGIVQHGFNSYLRGTGTFPYPPTNPVLYWLYHPHPALECVAFSIAFINLYPRWQHWSNSRRPSSGSIAIVVE